MDAGRVILTLALILLTGVVIAAVQTPQDEFQPATQLGEQLPGAPFVFVAYAFVWLALLGYVFIISRQLTRVQRELDAVAAKLKRQA